MKLAKALVLYIVFVFMTAVVGLPFFLVREYKPEWINKFMELIKKTRSA